MGPTSPDWRVPLQGQSWHCVWGLRICVQGPKSPDQTANNGSEKIEKQGHAQLPALVDTQETKGHSPELNSTPS